MALSKQCNSIKDLLQCGICLMVIKEPKLLPCLHSYCRKCITKHAKWTSADGEKKHQCGTVRCPLCSKDFPIPLEAEQGRSNVGALKVHQEAAESLQTKNLDKCSCCGEADAKAKAYCSDCDGFICEGCSSQHGVILCLKSHKTIPCGDLESAAAGKVRTGDELRQQYCGMHEDEKAAFHCKTCDKLVCDVCTYVEHLNHEFVGLQIAIEEQRSELKRLASDCNIVSEAVAESLQVVETVQTSLRTNVEKAQSDLRQAADRIRTRVLADIKHKEDHAMAKILKAASENNKMIETHKETLQSDQTRFQTALQMAEATHSGPDHNFTLFFSILKNSMIRLISDTAIEEIDDDLGVVNFMPSKSMSTLPTSLGTVSTGSGEDESVPRPMTPISSLVTRERNFFPWE